MKSAGEPPLGRGEYASKTEFYSPPHRGGEPAKPAGGRLTALPLLEDRLRQHGMNTFRLIDKLGYV
jgi:hypothetical protein